MTDPLKVRCPKCGMPPGRACRKVTDGKGQFAKRVDAHKDRMRAAVARESLLAEVDRRARADFDLR